jgi:dTDP-4-amino-4,6-dideoxygalactose transaminase
MNMINVTKTDMPPIKDYIECLEELWESKWVTNNGKFVQAFETKLQEYLKVKNISPVANGTLALHVALKVLEIRGEVITTPFTFPTTTNVLLWEGLTPVFADIDPQTWNIDPVDIEEKITENTSAILAVHCYGNPCYVERLQKIADEYSLKLIYDAAHSFGVQYKNEYVVNYGDVSCLSFHATKIMHTIEGGAIVAKRNDISDKIKLMINHGIKSEEKVELAGTNAKMNEFQAAMGLCNLNYVDTQIKKREKLYSHYKEKLSGLDIQFQKLISSKHNYIYMPVLFESLGQRDKVYSNLIQRGIKTRKYFFPLTVSSSYFQGKNLVDKYNLNVALDISNRVLCLPLYSDLGMETIDVIIDIIKKTIERSECQTQLNESQEIVQFT